MDGGSASVRALLEVQACRRSRTSPRSQLLHKADELAETRRTPPVASRFLWLPADALALALSARDLAEKIIGLEGKDSRDRALRNDMVKRVGKALKLLRQQGVAVSRGRNGDLAWTLA